MNIRLPAHVQKILTVFNNAGFEAYLVGGAVRDLLLSKTPSDYDITTSARPQQTIELCTKQDWQIIDKLGNNFGCVIALVDGYPTEITTFRGERYNENDAHRPAETWFCSTLKEDLSRRDFTINAMAMDIHGALYDYFGGRQDLEDKILRTVGTAHKRFEEDALRMLRACRFVAQLGFSYVQSGCEALPACGMPGTPYYLPHGFSFPAGRCNELSLERVRKEIEKLLLSEQAGQGLMLMMATGLLDSCYRVRKNGCDTNISILPEAKHLLGLHQNPKFHLYDTWEHTLLAVDNSPRELTLRWALLLHDLGKGLPNIRKLNKEGQPTDPGHEAASADMAKNILQRFGYDAKFVHLVTWLVAQHMRFAPMLITGERTLLRWARSEAKNSGFKSQAALSNAYSLLVEVFLADMGATRARDNEKMMADGRQIGKQLVELVRTRMPVCNSDLHISGKELLSIIPKEKIGVMLAYLLQRVQSGNLPNANTALLEAARKHIERSSQAKEKIYE